MLKEDLYKDLQKVVCPKIAEAISDFVMQDRLTFYGYFLQNVNFYKTKIIRTAGVNFTDLRMNFYYNEGFVNKLSMKQVKFLCIHELFHLLFNHPTRGKGYIHQIANFSMDMIINEIILEKYCDDIFSVTNNEKKLSKPAVAEFIPGCVKMDSNYKNERIFELVYTWTNDKYNLWKEKYEEEYKKSLIKNLTEEEDSCHEDLVIKSEEEISDERRKENEELGIDDYTRRFFESNFPSFDEHFWDDIPEEIRSQIVQKHINNLRARGIMSEDSEEIIGRLIKKSNNDFIRILKKGISQLKGVSKTSSFRRPSRKGLEGLKGKVKYSNCINCILDTSGSMIGSFELVLSEIFKDDYLINLIQCDAEVKKFVIISNKGQIQKMKIKGLGGTTLQPGIEYILSNKDLKSNNLVILTDGATDSLDFSKCNGMKVLILSADKPCPLLKHSNSVKQIIVKTKK